MSLPIDRRDHGGRSLAGESDRRAQRRLHACNQSAAARPFPKRRQSPRPADYLDKRDKVVTISSNLA